MDADRAGPRGLADFAGLWRLDRRIEDRRSGQAGRFEGEAVFTPAPDGFVYDETGLLTIGGAALMTATRRYLWSEAGGRIVVRFADGRAFHDFDPADPSASHWCDPDAYRVSYDFARWPDWTATWDVAGPRKDYRMTTAYRRG